MPTFNTPNSQSTYTVPSDADGVEVLVRGGSGGDGATDFNTGVDPGAGGPGGEVVATLPVDGGETLIANVGQDGGQSSSGGAGGSSPIDGGVAGGNGGETGNGDLGGGGGGAPSGVVRQSDGTAIAVGGGGGGGSSPSRFINIAKAGSGGGGGSRGGVGGAAGSSQDADGSPGQDGDGTGSGGDGGDGPDVSGNSGSPGNDGEAGGTVTNGELVDVTTGTSTAGPIVELTPRTAPPAPTNVAVDAVGDESLTLSWTANHSNGQTRVEIRPVADLSFSTAATVDYTTTSVLLTGLLNGQEFIVRIVAVNDAGLETEDATAVALDIESGETFTFTKPLGVADSPFDPPIRNAGTVQPDDL